MSTLRNEAVLYTFAKERQSLEEVIGMCNEGDARADKLRKSLLYKFGMLCHTKNDQQNEMESDDDVLDVSYFFFLLNHF